MKAATLALVVVLGMSTSCGSQHSSSSTTGSPGSSASVTDATSATPSSTASSAASTPSSELAFVESRIDAFGFHTTSDQRGCIAGKIVGDPVLGPLVSSKGQPTSVQLAAFFAYFFDCGLGVGDFADLFAKQFSSSGSYTASQLACVRAAYAELTKDQVLSLISRKDPNGASQIGATITGKCNLLTAPATT